MMFMAIIIAIVLISFKGCNNRDNKNTVNYSGMKWNGTQQINTPTEQKYIAVSGITDLTFIANSTKQSVNFVNLIFNFERF